MAEGNKIEQKADKALESIEGIRRAEPAPWFYTRVQAKLYRDQKTPWFKLGSYMSRPVVAVAGLCLILVANGYFLLQQQKPVNSTAQIEQGISMENESILASNSSYDYENLSLP